MATSGQFYWPPVGSSVAAYGQFGMAANTTTAEASQKGSASANSISLGRFHNSLLKQLSDARDSPDPLAADESHPVPWVRALASSALNLAKSRYGSPPYRMTMPVSGTT